MNDKSYFLVRMQKINKEHQIRKELEEGKKSRNGKKFKQRNLQSQIQTSRA